MGVGKRSIGSGAQPERGPRVVMCVMSLVPPTAFFSTSLACASRMRLIAAACTATAVLRDLSPSRPRSTYSLMLLCRGHAAPERRRAGGHLVRDRPRSSPTHCRVQRAPQFRKRGPCQRRDLARQQRPEPTHRAAGRGARRDRCLAAQPRRQLGDVADRTVVDAALEADAADGGKTGGDRPLPGISTGHASAVGDHLVDTRWQASRNRQPQLGARDGDCDVLHGLRPSEVASSGASRASHRPAAPSGAGTVPRSTASPGSSARRMRGDLRAPPPGAAELGQAAQARLNCDIT